MLLLLVNVLLTSVDAGDFVKKTVRITNAVGANTDLTVHCKSKDDDLGDHVLHSGESFEFHFRQNFWGSTLFYCSFEWRGALLPYLQSRQG